MGANILDMVFHLIDVELFHFYWWIWLQFNNFYKKKDVLILGEGPTQELNDTALTVEKTYSISFTKSRKKCLGCIINGAKGYFL